MTNAEFKRQLEERTKVFAVKLLNWLSLFPNNRVVGTVVFQLAKSGTAIGANYREGNKAKPMLTLSTRLRLLKKNQMRLCFG